MYLLDLFWGCPVDPSLWRAAFSRREQREQLITNCLPHLLLALRGFSNLCPEAVDSALPIQASRPRVDIECLSEILAERFLELLISQKVIRVVGIHHGPRGLILAPFVVVGDFRI